MQRVCVHPQLHFLFAFPSPPIAHASCTPLSQPYTNPPPLLLLQSASDQFCDLCLYLCLHPRALSSVSSVSVLQFKDVGSAFGNFTRPEDWTKFAARVRHYGDAWCCVDAHPGHVYYDLLWDVPHVDMHNRRWNGSWHVAPGP